MSGNRLYKVSSIGLLLVLLLGCSNEDRSLDSQLVYWLDYHGVEAAPAPTVVDISSPEARLGKLLFFSTSLSGNDQVACVSCHHPLLGGADQLPLPIGVDVVEPDVLGKARASFNEQLQVPRNSPTTFNSSLWQRSLFFDGRIERLDHSTAAHTTSGISTPDVRYGDVDSTVTSLIDAQAGFPVTSEHEMRASFEEDASNERIRKQLVANLIDDVEQDRRQADGSQSWDTLFLEVYPEDAGRPLEELLAFERVQTLIGQYERSQVFIDTPWNRYLKGDKSALSESQKSGAILFHTPVEQGGAGCVACHHGPMLTDESFHVLAVPHAGVGKDINEEDTGRFLRTGIFDDRYAFRTPALINAEHTAPYGHSGVFETLEGIIRHHLDPRKSVSQFDYDALNRLQPGLAHRDGKKFSSNALAQLLMLREQGRADLKDVSLSDQQVDELVAFMTALTDPCIESPRCLGPWIPAIDDPDPGGSLVGLELRSDEGS